LPFVSKTYFPPNLNKSSLVQANQDFSLNYRREIDFSLFPSSSSGLTLRVEKKAVERIQGKKKAFDFAVFKVERPFSSSSLRKRRYFSTLYYDCCTHTTPILSLSPPPFSLSLSHTHTHALTHTCTHTHSIYKSPLTLSLSLSLYLSLFIFL